jgi:hypothetical protein
MVVFITQAIGWGWSQLLRRPRNQPVSHRELEHAHWDPVGRRWFIHADRQTGEVARAA